MNLLKRTVFGFACGTFIGILFSFFPIFHPVSQFYKLSGEETVKYSGHSPRVVKSALLKKILAASDASFERVFNKTSFSSEISLIKQPTFQTLKTLNLVSKQVAAFCLPKEKLIVMSDEQPELFTLKLFELNHERIHCEFGVDNEGLAELMAVILTLDYGIAHNDRYIVGGMFNYIQTQAYDLEHGYQLLAATEIAKEERWRFQGTPFELTQVFQHMQDDVPTMQNLTLYQSSRGKDNLESFVKGYFAEHSLEYLPDESNESLRKHVLSCLFRSWSLDCHPGANQKFSRARKIMLHTYSQVPSQRIVTEVVLKPARGTPMVVFEPLPADPNPLASLILEGRNHALR